MKAFQSLYSSCLTREHVTFIDSETLPVFFFRAVPAAVSSVVVSFFGFQPVDTCFELLVMVAVGIIIIWPALCRYTNCECTCSE